MVKDLVTVTFQQQTRNEFPLETCPLKQMLVFWFQVLLLFLLPFLKAVKV